MKLWPIIIMSAVVSTHSVAQQNLPEVKNQFCQDTAALGQNMLEKMLDQHLTLDEALQANQLAKDEHQSEHIYVFMSQMLMEAGQIAQQKNSQTQDRQLQDFYHKYYNICRYQFIDATTDAHY